MSRGLKHLARGTLVVVVVSAAVFVTVVLAFTSPAFAQAAASPVAANDPLPPGLRGYYDTLLAEGEWGAVLNLQRLGLEAIDQGHLDVAARALDAGIQRIEVIYANSESAKKARSLWSSEGSKDFKGEPYERAMTYYYRGLLFMADGDYENARASFRSAEYQDTISNSEEHAGDFGLMSLLSGWASTCAGDAGMATDYYQRASTQQPQGLKAPAAGSAALVLVESGTSPVKTATGSYGEALQLKAGDNPFVAALANGTELPLLGDIGWQASTLGGRQIDSILGGKAIFRKGAETVAGIGLEGATFAIGLDDGGGAAGALAAVGIAAVLVSSATKPKADIRHWDNLPDRIYGTFVKSVGKAGLTVAEKTADGELYPIEHPTLDRTAGRCRLVLYRAREPGALRPQAVTNLSAGERKSLYKRNEARDAAFRNEMNRVFVANDEALAGAE
jgi:tetratricopeptide (TPR) repeat protein